MRGRIRTRLGVALLCCAALSSVSLIGYTTYGVRWSGTVVSFYVNANSVRLSASSIVNALQQAAAVWPTQTSTDIRLNYAGTTSGSSIVLNYRNEVFFRNDNVGYGGETYWWADASSKIVDSDIVLHEGGAPIFAGSGCSGGMYLEDLATHEFGHMLGLGHSSAYGATMNSGAYTACGFDYMSLESDDIAGARALYPQTSSSPSKVPATSPDGTQVPTVGQVVDSQGAVWTLGWDGKILRNGAHAAGGYGSKILWSGGVIYVLGTDSAWYRWTGSSWAREAATAASSTSADGTRIPSASQITDAQGAVWTLGWDGKILRNGAHAAGGYGSQILWSGGVIYVFGTDSAWYRWTGSSWAREAATAASSTSADGTRIPSASQITDAQGAVWTLGWDGKILRNGAHAAGGYGSQILWSGGVIYVFGTDSAWYRWTGSSWAREGATAASNTSADGTRIPSASQITDAQGAVWTLGWGGMIVRNGVHAAGGYGSQILWSGGVIYVFGTDSAWHRWTGSSWQRL